MRFCLFPLLLLLAVLFRGLYCGNGSTSDPDHLVSTGLPPARRPSNEETPDLLLHAPNFVQRIFSYLESIYSGIHKITNIVITSIYISLSAIAYFLHYRFWCLVIDATQATLPYFLMRKFYMITRVQNRTYYGKLKRGVFRFGVSLDSLCFAFMVFIFFNLSSLSVGGGIFSVSMGAYYVYYYMCLIQKTSELSDEKKELSYWSMITSAPTAEELEAEREGLEPFEAAHKQPTVEANLETAQPVEEHGLEDGLAVQKGPSKKTRSSSSWWPWSSTSSNPKPKAQELLPLEDVVAVTPSESLSPPQKKTDESTPSPDPSSLAVDQDSVMKTQSWYDYYFGSKPVESKKEMEVEPHADVVVDTSSLVSNPKEQLDNGKPAAAASPSKRPVTKKKTTNNRAAKKSPNSSVKNSAGRKEVKTSDSSASSRSAPSPPKTPRKSPKTTLVNS